MALVAPSTAASITDATPQAGWTPEQKKVIATKIEQHADLMRFCLQAAQRKFGDLVGPEDLRALGTTLFLSALK